ncbi:QacE [Aeromonas sp. CA23]|nr:QacE [Aeromonas sp. CA23]
MEEKIFFNQGNVSVSNSRFIVDGQTYAMNNVTSVKSGVVKPNRLGSIIIGLIGLAMVLSGSGGVLIGGLVLLAIAVLSWMGNKKRYTVLLHTSSGENQALASPDESYIRTVINSLNDAIVSRG